MANNNFPLTTPTTQVAAQAFMGNQATTLGLPNSNNFDLITYLCAITGNLLQMTPLSGIGYTTGNGLGSSVTQATSKVTAFTLNTPTGRIILNNGALAGYATSSSATWTCSAITSYDVVAFTQYSGTIGAYIVNTVCSAGSAQFCIANVSSASLSEAPAFQYVVINGAIT